MARLYKRGRYWHADYSYQGKRIRTSLKTSDEAEAQEKLRQITKEPPLPRQKDIPLGKLVEGYLIFARTEKSIRGVINEGYVLKNFLKSVNAKTVRQVEISHIQDYKVLISTKKANTIRNHLKAIRALLNYAKTLGFLEENPAMSIKVPPQPKQAPKFLTVPQLRILLSELPPRSRNIVYFFAKTGLRRSEGLNLTWEDMKGDHIIVPQTKHPTRAFRIVPIDRKIQALLRKLPRKGDRIFQITLNQFVDDFQKARKKANLEWVTIHMLRHTYASHLVMNGVGIRTVQELLGHTQVETTMIYAHLSNKHLHESAKKLPY